jgi:hypothetical protein
LAGVFTGREDKRLLPCPVSSPATHKANEEIKTICVFILLFICDDKVI